MLEVDKKGTKMLKCSSPSCRNRKVISRLTNLRCDNCHKKMTLFGNGENATYRCQCGNSLKQKEVDKRIKSSKKDKSKSCRYEKIHETRKTRKQCFSRFSRIEIKIRC